MKRYGFGMVVAGFFTMVACSAAPEKGQADDPSAGDSAGGGEVGADSVEIVPGVPDRGRDPAVVAIDIAGEGLCTGTLIDALWALPSVKKVDWDGRDKLRLMVDDAATATPAVTEVLHRRGTQFTALMPYLPSFDEVFIELVQRQ